MYRRNLYQLECIKSVVVLLVLVISITKECVKFMGGYAKIIYVISSIIAFYQGLKLLYMSIIPLRNTWLRKIMSKIFKEALEEFEGVE